MKKIESVLLISLPAVLEESDTYLDDGHSFHLGLAYLAGVLRENGISVKILDCYAEARQNPRPGVETGWLELGLSDEEILEHIDGVAPELIGITVPFSCQHDLSVKLAAKIKTRLPHVVLVAGGNHISGDLDNEDLQVYDFRVIGEGEYAFLDLILALNNGGGAAGIKGVVARGEHDYQSAPAIKDLDRLPFPAIDLLPLEKIWDSDRRWINLIATRGCVYDCIFCSIHTVMGHNIRRRSIEHVVEEISHWKKLYDIQEVYFEDDNLTVNRAWAKTLFRAIAELNLGLRLHVRNGIRADSVDEELLALMKAAGFQDISISPESGSPGVLSEIIHKTQDLADVLYTLELARKINLGVNAFFVMGFYEETWEDLHRTVNFARELRKLGCSGFWFSLVTPFPGTEIHRQYSESGRLEEPVDLRRLRSVDYIVRNPYYTASELKGFRAEVMRELAPDSSVTRTLGRALRLAIYDPHFAWVKFRYKVLGSLRKGYRHPHGQEKQFVISHQQ